MPARATGDAIVRWRRLDKPESEPEAQISALSVALGAEFAVRAKAGRLEKPQHFWAEVAVLARGSLTGYLSGLFWLVLPGELLLGGPFRSQTDAVRP